MPRAAIGALPLPLPLPSGGWRVAGGEWWVASAEWWVAGGERPGTVGR
ncbi:hypothetical protein ACFV4E_37745 [Streptomyces hygroscopicus]|nr:hypothetical protein [Streptomyces hygroscopicus]